MMTDRQLAAHPLDDSIEIAACGQMRQESSVLLPHCVPIGAVHVGRVKVIAIDAPRLVEHLGPLDARVYANFDVVDVDLALPWLRLWSDRYYRPHVVTGVE